MAARFQRLDSSEDIAAGPKATYSSIYYDEPQNIYPMNERRRSSTTRKPVPMSSPPQQYPLATTPEQPLIESYYNTPRMDSNSPHPSSLSNPFTDSKRPSMTSVVAKTASAVWSKARGQHVSQVSAPLWAAPWRHQPCDDLGGSGSSTVRFFDHMKQRNRIFVHFFLQWLVPVAFCGALVAVLILYSSKSKVTQREKYMFNTLMVGFSLCLGFAVTNGMKEYASILRWRLLARRYRSLQEFELLLGLASQKKALRLMWVGRTPGSFLPNGTQLLCLCYLTLMLGLQIVIALLGLCYSVETALFDHNLIRGNVSIADLSYFKQADTVNMDIDKFQLQSGAINAYGITGQQYPVRVQKNTTSDKDHEISAYQLQSDNSTMWWYWFTDVCPEEKCTTLYVTNRYVTSQAQCVQYNVVAGGYAADKNVTYIDNLGRKKYLPYLETALSATTTWYANTLVSCGDRCTTVYAVNVGYQNTRQGVLWRPQVFQCNNTISQVGNIANLTDSKEYELPDEQARLIAGAIGYNGAAYENSDYQTHVYDGGSLWSWTRMNGVPMTTTDIANSLMHFSMGAVAAIDFGGPRNFVIGKSPIPAQEVEVKWKYAILVLVLVPVVQFMVLLVAVVWGNHAIIRDDSFLSAANLLRPIIEKLERTACALTSDEICEVLGNPGVAYGVRMQHGNTPYGGMAKGHDDVMHLDVLFEDESNTGPDWRWSVGRKMPQGRYDGLKKVDEKTAAAVTGSATEAEAKPDEARLRRRRKSF